MYHCPCGSPRLVRRRQSAQVVRGLSWLLNFGLTVWPLQRATSYGRASGWVPVIMMIAFLAQRA